MTKPARPKGKPLTPEERRGIIDGYAAGVSIRTINLAYGYAKPTIHRTIKAAGGELRNDATPAKFSDAQLRAWHRWGRTVQEIADKTGANSRTIYKRMAKAGLRLPEIPERLPSAEIMAAYAGGSSMRALAKQHDAHISTIRRLIVNNGGTIRTNNVPPSGAAG
ncbi:hypothetical protein MB46_03430 [Arthrobacter alpinus]|uniref:helix-turn-helix domain-containing protein n=1 Tax=Arthrobacter alpinus TaxID=656366 RepID=UPI0005C8DBB2|nr:helix-turn-helix domain-containing protein [Arthrobacter alpinus]ALV44703.1 hypothetical protein MB46_03430 [Arthrobacter alpinus]